MIRFRVFVLSGFRDILASPIQLNHENAKGRKREILQMAEMLPNCQRTTAQTVLQYGRLYSICRSVSRSGIGRLKGNTAEGAEGTEILVTFQHVGRVLAPTRLRL